MTFRFNSWNTADLKLDVETFFHLDKGSGDWTLLINCIKVMFLILD